MSTMLNRLLSKVIPPITASAGGCEYEKHCHYEQSFGCWRWYILYSNCHLYKDACGSCHP